MEPRRISITNTPDMPGVSVTTVSFNSHGDALSGLLYQPDARLGPLPGVVVTGAWTTVKEQMAATYARELATRGLMALAFDFRGWGASAGSPRYVENPTTKTEDIHAALDFLRHHPGVDATRIYGLGICASSGYMLSAAADSPTMQSCALIAPWLHTPELATQIYGGPEVVKQLRESATTDMVVTAASTTDASAPMFQAPYYTEPERGLIREYNNQFALSTWEHWLSYDAHASAERLRKALLVICSDAAALPQGVKAYLQSTQAPTKERWLAGINQFDFYDRLTVVTQSADEVARFFAGQA